jgi:hypothetical protein
MRKRRVGRSKGEKGRTVYMRWRNRYSMDMRETTMKRVENK